MNSKKAILQLEKLDKLGSKIRLAAEEWGEPWKILISTIMSARTKDEVTIPVAIKLFNRFNSLKSLSKASLKEIEIVIKPVNFYKNKSRNILSCSKLLMKNYNSEIPKNIEKLIELPGVGRKTANVFLSELGSEAIAVDTHCAYISKKLDWTKNENPEKIEIDLKNLFPKKLWSSLNPITVRFGKTYTSKKEKDDLLKEISNV
jgi:endonuclease III